MAINMCDTGPLISCIALKLIFIRVAVKGISRHQHGVIKVSKVHIFRNDLIVVSDNLLQTEGSINLVTHMPMSAKFPAIITIIAIVDTTNFSFFNAC